MQEIILGECLEVMRSFPDNHVSCIVTDPPYGLKFMGKKWDYGIPAIECWSEMLRILKPGGYLLAMGGSRTFHRLCCKIEDAGFEIRDTLMWLYGTGFPKSHNHFGFEGYGTALKPSWEPIIMAMKPLEGTFKQNAEKWGVAGINIDESRIGTGGTKRSHQAEYPKNENGREDRSQHWARSGHSVEKNGKGRWPANLLLDESYEQILCLKNNIPNDIIQVIKEYFYDYQMPSMSKRIQDVSMSSASEQRSVLQQEMLLSGTQQSNEGRQTFHVGKETQEKINRENEETTHQERLGQSHIQGILDGAWISLCKHSSTSNGSTNFGQENDKSRRNSGTSTHNGIEIGSSFTDLGNSSSCERSEGRQSNGESRSIGQLDSQERTQGNLEGIASIEKGKRRIEILACDIPEKWLKYFHLSGEKIRSPYCAAEMLDQQTGVLKSGRHTGELSTESKNSIYGKRKKANINPFESNSGAASRFFYCAKASSAERNQGLDDIKHVMYNETIDLKDEESNLWEELGLKANTLQDSDILQKKDIIVSLFGIQSPKVLELLCIMFTSGKRPLGRFLRVLMYTILIRTNKTIELKIFNLLINWSINESIQDAKSLMESGINPVNYAQYLNQLIKIIGISQEKDGLNMEGVDPVILVKSWLKKEQEKLEKDLLKHSGGHPTVKPIALMEYLLKLVMPPSNGLILDPFAGSGTTIVAAKRLGFDAIGIEKEAEYYEIAKKRVEAAKQIPEQMEMFV